MAAPNPSQCEPKPPYNTVLFHRLSRVVGATRKETAVLSDQRADEILVGLQQPPNQPSHFGKRRSKQSISARNAAFLEPPRPVDSRSTRSHSGNSTRIILNASRPRRLTRLRSTARRASFLPTTSPNLADPKPPGLYKSWKCSLRSASRKAKTDENSSVLLSLWTRPKDWRADSRPASAGAFRRPAESGPLPGAPEVPHDPHECAIEPKNRACACVGRLKVDKCVS